MKKAVALKPTLSQQKKRCCWCLLRFSQCNEQKIILLLFSEQPAPAGGKEDQFLEIKRSNNVESLQQCHNRTIVLVACCIGPLHCPKSNNFIVDLETGIIMELGYCKAIYWMTIKQPFSNTHLARTRKTKLIFLVWVSTHQQWFRSGTVESGTPIRDALSLFCVDVPCPS